MSSALTQGAQAAAHMKNTYLSAQFHRSAAPRGKKRAIVAVAHSILIIAYHLIQKRQPYQDMGGDYFDMRDAETTKQRLVVRLEKLGYQVALQSKQATASA